MDTQHIEELRIQLKKGKIQKGYRAILEYILFLQTYLKKKYVEYDFPGTLYHGYLDMSYFAFITQKMKERRLKIAVVFNYEAFRFEIWLSGYNKSIQKMYLEQFKKLNMESFFIPERVEGYDSIVEDHIEIDELDRERTTKELEERIIRFVKIVEDII